MDPEFNLAIGAETEVGGHIQDTKNSFWHQAMIVYLMFVLLGKKMLATHHCSIEDVITVMELYCANDTPYKRNEAGRKLFFRNFSTLAQRQNSMIPAQNPGILPLR